MTGIDTVFFLSDYGRGDELVGVVHAVILRLAPRARVVDLTHEVSPFDVRAAAWTLARAVPHLGPGVVLGVVDPGVGGSRRAVAVEAPPGTGPRWLVGPDNGLLVPAVESLGGARGAVSLEPAGDAAGVGRDPLPPAVGPVSPPVVASVTFDGRDLFAPAVAALCRGVPLDEMGRPFDPQELVHLPPPVLEQMRVAHGEHGLRAEVTWVDRFGNVQLAVRAEDVGGPPPPVATLSVVGRGGEALGGPVEAGTRGDLPSIVRGVRTFGDLDRHEVGLLIDANGHLAVVVREGSAAAVLEVRAGSLLELTW